RVAAWVDVVEDLSGLETDGRPWTPREELPSTLRAILGEVGRVYAPFLLANAAALEAGADSVECTIDGRPWTQKPFPYQGKCLFWLREAREALAVEDRHAVDGILVGTGCEALFKRS
ncbi:MAG: glutathione S-transferase, partial [Alphaproteobacteria bacterium]